MQWAWRNGNFWNGKMIVCTVIASYHKCQSYLTTRQNNGWPQFEAIKLRSNQNKNKKLLSQVYFFVFTGNHEGAQPQWIRAWAKLQVSLCEDSGLCPLCFLWAAGTEERNRQQLPIFFPRVAARSKGGRHCLTETWTCYRVCLAFKIWSHLHWWALCLWNQIHNK